MPISPAQRGSNHKAEPCIRAISTATRQQQQQRSGRGTVQWSTPEQLRSAARTPQLGPHRGPPDPIHCHCKHTSDCKSDRASKYCSVTLAVQSSNKSENRLGDAAAVALLSGAARMHAMCSAAASACADAAVALESCETTHAVTCLVAASDRCCSSPARLSCAPFVDSTSHLPCSFIQ